VNEDGMHAKDPGVEVARERGERFDGVAAEPLRTSSGSIIRIGTASWTDPTLVRSGAFYPSWATSPEERLRFYASQFSLVEVDATYYALPAPRMAELWALRTPEDFVFNIKAHALMTGQPSEVSRLPKPMRDALPESLQSKTRVYGKDLPAEIYDEVWTTFADALRPLRDSAKLGSVLLQYPRWFLPGSANRAAILEARDRLSGMQIGVEFRNALWFNERNTERTLRFLEDERIPYVVVDEPQGLKSSVPPIARVTAPELAIVRFHGRRADTWEKPRVTVAERYRYLYEDKELQEWVPRIEQMAADAREVHVLMNNCYANYGTTNAQEIASLLRKTYGATAGVSRGTA
jgi:uncharacterized protein YecE (DUF72 family)